MITVVKQGATKEKIIKLITSGNNTLSGISKSLNLAPSTVSKHLHDLEVSGTIQQKDTSFARKWKYYQLNSGTITPETDNFVPTSRHIPIYTGIAVIAAAAIILYVLFNSAYSSSYIPISITDPPQVPAGTQALYINYSSFYINTYYNGQPEWVPVNSSGRLDLMGLVNASQVIGSVNLKHNSTITGVEFRITSSQIVIDNTTYNVYATNPLVSAKLSATYPLNSSSGILLDFSPVVTQSYSNSSAFIMLPSLSAMVVSGRSFGFQKGPHGYPVQVHPLPIVYRNRFGAQNASISGSALAVSGNTTSLSISLDNSGSQNLTVFGVVLSGKIVQEGPINITINTSVNDSNRTVALNSYGSQMYPQRGRGQGWFKVQSNSTIIINAAALYYPGMQGPGAVRLNFGNHPENVSIVDFLQRSQNGVFIPSMQDSITFVAEKNGTLELPILLRHPIFNNNQDATWAMEMQMPSSYIISAHSAGTLSYNGNLTPDRFFRMRITSNSTYVLSVITNRGVIKENITAT